MRDALIHSWPLRVGPRVEPPYRIVASVAAYMSHGRGWDLRSTVAEPRKAIVRVPAVGQLFLGGDSSSRARRRRRLGKRIA